MQLAKIAWCPEQSFPSIQLCPRPSSTSTGVKHMYWRFIKKAWAAGSQLNSCGSSNLCNKAEQGSNIYLQASCFLQRLENGSCCHVKQDKVMRCFAEVNSTVQQISIFLALSVLDTGIRLENGINVHMSVNLREHPAIGALCMCEGSCGYFASWMITMA
jgi:hypothetical protein